MHKYSIEIEEIQTAGCAIAIKTLGAFRVVQFGGRLRQQTARPNELLTDASKAEKNIARIANAVQCHS